MSLFCSSTLSLTAATAGLAPNLTIYTFYKQAIVQVHPRSVFIYTYMMDETPKWLLFNVSRGGLYYIKSRKNPNRTAPGRQVLLERPSEHVKFDKYDYVSSTLEELKQLPLSISVCFMWSCVIISLRQRFSFLLYNFRF